MNLPNFLTVCRVFFAGVFIWALLGESMVSKYIALAFFAVASITDFFDGYLARKRNQISTFGIIMDPIADKILVLSAFWLFMYFGIVAVWMVWLIIIREVLITGIRFYALSGGVPIAASASGKYKTVSQMVSVIFILLYICVKTTFLERSGAFPAAVESFSAVAVSVLMWIAVVLTAYSGISFLVKNRRLFLDADSR